MGGIVMGKSIIEIVGEIIAGQASQQVLTAEEIEILTKQTFRVFKELEALEDRGGDVSELEPPVEVQSATSTLHQSETEQTALAPIIDPRESVKEHAIVCVICGKEVKQL